MTYNEPLLGFSESRKEYSEGRSLVYRNFVIHISLGHTNRTFRDYKGIPRNNKNTMEF